MKPRSLEPYKTVYIDVRMLFIAILIFAIIMMIVGFKTVHYPTISSVI